MTSAPRRPEPAWTARPGPEVTLRTAAPGEVRTGHNGIQWWFDSERGWQPVVSSGPAPKSQRQPEWEAGV